MANDEKLKELITKLTIRNSYWGYLFARIRRRPNLNIPSIMGVAPEKNGTLSLVYHPYLVEKTDDKTLTWILEHEGMHVLNRHIPRLLRIMENELNQNVQMVKSKIWNVAADCTVNSQIFDFPKQLMVGDRLFDVCFPELYNLPEKKTSEFYYFKLLEQNKDDVEKAQNCDKEGAGADGEGQIGSEYDSFDDHSQWAEAVKDVLDKSSLSRKIDNYTQSMIKESAKTFQKRRGSLPGHIMEMIEEALAPPKAPYFQIIRKLVKGSRISKFKRSFTRINRKRTYVFNIGEQNIPQISPFPGRQRDSSFFIVVLIDTSGSMSKDDILEGLSGCKNIIENDRHCKVTVLENDTEVQKEYDIKKLRDIQFDIKGRGGTILQPGLERARELNPDITLVFTDGGCENINDLPRKMIPPKIIWVINSNDRVEHLNRSGYIVHVD